jgi:hypothetical protein
MSQSFWARLKTGRTTDHTNRREPHTHAPHTHHLNKSPLPQTSWDWGFLGVAPYRRSLGERSLRIPPASDELGLGFPGVAPYRRSLGAPQHSTARILVGEGVAVPASSSFVARRAHTTTARKQKAQGKIDRSFPTRTTTRPPRALHTLITRASKVSPFRASVAR